MQQRTTELTVYFSLKLLTCTGITGAFSLLHASVKELRKHYVCLASTST